MVESVLCLRVSLCCVCWVNPYFREIAFALKKYVLHRALCASIHSSLGLWVTKSLSSWVHYSGTLRWEWGRAMGGWLVLPLRCVGCDPFAGLCSWPFFFRGLVRGRWCRALVCSLEFLCPVSVGGLFVFVRWPLKVLCLLAGICGGKFYLWVSLALAVGARMIGRCLEAASGARWGRFCV